VGGAVLQDDLQQAVGEGDALGAGGGGVGIANRQGENVRLVQCTTAAVGILHGGADRLAGFDRVVTGEGDFTNGQPDWYRDRLPVLVLNGDLNRGVVGFGGRTAEAALGGEGEAGG